MQQGSTFRAADAGRVEFVNVAFREGAQDETRAAAIGSHGDAGDRRLGLVDLRAAIAGLIDVGVRLQLERLRRDTRGIDRLGEDEVEAVGLRFHLQNLERRGAGEDEALQ